MKLPTILFCFFLFLLTVSAFAADNNVTVDQIGNYNTVAVTQEGTGHTVTVNLGQNTDVDNTMLTILQQGTGAKTSSVVVHNGINNSVNIQQDGAGNHVASIQNLSGSGNDIIINQSGAGKHEFNVVNNAGSVNSGNTVTGTQSGGVGSDKWFNVNLNGATGATVNVVQDNPTTSGQASMNVQCLSGTCGAYSYISH